MQSFFLTSGLLVLCAGRPTEPGGKALRCQLVRADAHAGAYAPRDAQATVRAAAFRNLENCLFFTFLFTTHSVPLMRENRAQCSLLCLCIAVVIVLCIILVGEPSKGQTSKPCHRILSQCRHMHFNACKKNISCDYI